MDLDVKKLMLVLLERQKQYVLEDRENYSWAMVTIFTVDNQSYVAFPKFQDEASKIAEYSAIVKAAKAQGATLIITTNGARIGSPEMATRIEEYRWGDYDETNSRACIMVTASGPGLENCSVTLGYEIDGDMVRFDSEPEFLYGIELNLLPDWPATERSILS